jgi:CxxC motif-containing protein (DUF1111 family)
MMSHKTAMRQLLIIGLFAAVACAATMEACQYEASPVPVSALNEGLAGGSQTVFDQTGGAFSDPFPNMSAEESRLHAIGDGVFDETFVPSPAPVDPGLGPIFNNNGCVACHIGDGRGEPPADGEELTSMLFRVSIAGADPNGGPNPAPGFGTQLQNRAIIGALSEGNVSITYTEQTLYFADGTPYSLRVPTYTIIDPYTTLPPGMLVSPRVAPAVFGLGLLEAVPESEILEYADPIDANHDSIRGVPNYVWDVQAQALVLGRFGWKAGQPSILQQTAGAFNQDIGITNKLFPQESCFGQSQYSSIPLRPSQYGTDITDSLLSAAAFYVQSIGVPARRNMSDPNVIHGEVLFKQAGCISCHRQMMTTGVVEARPDVSNQIIFPYTDLLLHDMGTGLADNRPEFVANGQQWRTPPLWGIGLVQLVNGHNFFLHDGRARSLLEAVMWHGGEAENAREAVSNFSAGDRNALIAFLESL